MRTPPPIEEILPHRHGMLLVERLVSWDERQATVSAVPSASAWYAEPADFEAFLDAARAGRPL